MIFEYIRASNCYFDEQRRWIQVKENPLAGDVTLATCLYIIGNSLIEEEYTRLVNGSK